MPSKNSFNLVHTYLNLPDHFHEILAPEKVPSPRLICFNKNLANELALPENEKAYVDYIYHGSPSKTYAQAYAGHQFGHFNRLGDGRAIMLGEHQTEKGLLDLQLKGGGMTKFSRGGDGKATLKSMLREYLMSEAMQFLNISSSRSLAVFLTGEPVYRESVHEGASLIRIMKSHLRVGTFQYAAHLGEEGDVKALMDYTIQRLFPELNKSKNPAISLLEKVMQTQIELVSDWMRVGFIHGVMNTDNVAISGETFDYGPCAFMNTYDPKTVFSSIDKNGRYAFGNQPSIGKWNILRFAEALLPVINENQEVAIELAQLSIQKFDTLWNATYYGKMLQKIGFHKNERKLYPLVIELLEIMQTYEMDYTHTFVKLTEENELNSSTNEAFKAWYTKWLLAVEEHTTLDEAKRIMKSSNPCIIPRNHLVEKALDEAVNGEFAYFEELQKTLSNPYNYELSKTKFAEAPQTRFDKNYQTFCGT